MTIPRKKMPDRRKQIPVEYRDFDIQPMPSPSEEDPNLWEARVEISRTGDETAVRQYNSERAFPGRRQAEEYAVEFGKKIIDGNFPDYSPP